MLTFAGANDWQWHAANTVGNWAYSASYSVLSSSGASCPFTTVTNAGGASYGGFIFPYDRPLMRVKDDFDNDGKSDCWYFYAPAQVWYFVFSSSTQEVFRLSFGLPDAVPALEDYDGDHKTDPAVYQESSGTWLVMLSSIGYEVISITGFGGAGYSSVPADFDGDQRADPAIYNRTSGLWLLALSANGYNTLSGTFGNSSYAPLTGDFDMDDKADPIIYNETAGSLAFALSGSSTTFRRSNYSVTGTDYGGPGFTMLSNDYDGDGCADMAAYGRDSGLWYVMNYKLERLIWGIKWGGGTGYRPISGDYDGDGLADAAVFYRDQHDAIWHLDESTDGPRSISARSNRQ